MLEKNANKKNNSNDKSNKKKEHGELVNITQQEQEQEQQDEVFFVNVKTLTGTILRLQVSSLDAVIEIKQLLLETVETCYITHYELHVGDIKLQDYTDISEYSDIQPECTITMHTVEYDDKAARLHVHRLRELLSSKLNDMYLSRGIVKSIAQKKDPAFPSFSVPNPEEETSELASALDCDKEFEHNKYLLLKQHQPPSRKSPKQKKAQKSPQSQDTLSATTSDKQDYEQMVDELVAEIENTESASKKGKKKQKKKLAKNQKSNTEEDNHVNGWANEVANENAGDDDEKEENATEDENGDASFNSLHLGDADTLVPLGKWMSMSAAEAPKCIRSVTFSGFNPPPGNRKLIGDLFYLHIETIEGSAFHITARPNGFYVNGSTIQRFNPLPARTSHHSHTLLGILCSVSPYFRKTFLALLEVRVRKHPFEASPIPFHTPSWLVVPKTHEYDADRAEDSIFTMFGGDSRLQQRDFNEELQSCRELPSGTMEERIIRDRTLFKIHAEFYEAAVRGAKAVVDKTLLSLNPMDPLPTQVYVQNNIFFSMAVDDRKILESGNQLTHFEIDPVTYASTNNELKSVRDINVADVRGIHTLASALVDYKGYRILAHSVIPGILQANQGSKHVYGFIEDGADIYWDEKYHKLVEEAAEKLHVKPHVVLDENEKEYMLAGSSECKGIVGSDGRFYLLDYMRTTPRDANFPDDNGAILRRSLIDNWVETKQRERVLSDMERRRQQGEELEVDEEQERRLDEEITKLKKSIRFNPDVFVNNEKKKIQLLPDTEETEEDKRAVKELARFLKETIIPRFVEDYSKMENSMPLDGRSLTEAMHEHGINIRYLGHMAKVMEESNMMYMAMLSKEEMVARAAKWELRKLLLCTPDVKFAKNIETFLNCLLSRHSINSTSRRRDTEYLITHDKISFSQQSLIQCLIESIKTKYQYDLDPSFFSTCNPLSLLRNLCLKVGLQVSCRIYDFNNPNPFTVSDVQGVVPVVKHSIPTSSTAKGLLEVGKKQLEMGQLESAYEFLNQAIVMCQQVRGPMNRDTAQCFGYLSAILHSASEFPQAIIHQHKALIINRREFGIDSTTTCQLHQILGLLCHAISQNEFALKHFLRARYICRLISAAGENHPDLATMSSNVGMMYQHMGDIPQAMKYMEEGLRINENTLGHETIPTASSLHAIAYLHSLTGDNRKALQLEQESFKILSKVLPKSEQSRELLAESQRWMSQFTGKAVQQQRHTNEMMKQQQLDNARELLRESPYFTAMNKLSNKLGGTEEFMKWLQDLQQSSGAPLQREDLDQLAHALLGDKDEGPKTRSTRRQRKSRKHKRGARVATSTKGASSSSQ